MLRNQLHNDKAGWIMENNYDNGLLILVRVSLRHGSRLFPTSVTSSLLFSTAVALFIIAASS